MITPPPPSPSSPPPTFSSENAWGPYTTTRDFDAKAVIILITLIATVITALFFFQAFLRFLLHRLHRQIKPLKSLPVDPPPALLFSPSTKMAGVSSDCVICLSDFAAGDHVRVLPSCGHGFHVKCIDAWLASKPSCPTCRAAFGGGSGASAGAGQPEP
ncbi:Zinc finger RING/FYVE/PHD-type protein [Dioscorea alata]|uniref:Zinc finger RING/FYVE/PHD-type protein n=1 Tax=Dioscorea alata TaxID=55571 RepID=A0ACB7V4A7_DIOAL|nr:Zinc finger RING/FYVE/PHD-type protein [Dioscorea alata]